MEPPVDRLGLGQAARLKWPHLDQLRGRQVRRHHSTTRAPIARSGRKGVVPASTAMSHRARIALVITDPPP